MPWNFHHSTVEGLCPGAPCRSIVEGSCPVNALTIQNVEGTCPGMPCHSNALMVPHACALLHCRCSSLCCCIVVVVGRVAVVLLLLVEFEHVGNIVNHKIY